jgi:hypothetical protein
MKSDENIHLKMSLLFLNGEKEFELGGQLLFGVQAIREVYAADTTVCMDLHAQSFYIIRAVGAAREVGEVELDLIPPFVETHRHRADEGLHTSGGLIVRGAEASPHVFVVEHLHFEGEVFF